MLSEVIDEQVHCLLDLLNSDTQPGVVDGESRTANWVKQQLFRGRERLCLLVRAEVASELQSARPEDVEEELAALRLLEYCQR